MLETRHTATPKAVSCDLSVTFQCCHTFQRKKPQMKKAVFLLIFNCGYQFLYAQAYKTSNPDSIKIITTDLANFWETFDRLSSAQTLHDTIEIVQKYYLDKASYGLQEYVKASNATSADLVNAIKKHRNYLLSIRQTTSDIHNHKARIIEAARKLKSIYPSSSFPQIYFVIGKFEVGGTQFTNLLYIGAELMCASSTSPLQEIKEEIRPMISTVNDIATVCIHEVIHYQQKYQDATNILDGALIEGGADFITKQITGKATAYSCFEYGYKHEKKLWTDFKSQAAGKNFLKWFVNIPDTLNQRPGMLGYFIGYRICEEYYRNSTNKEAALRRIIELKNPTEIYHKSKYIGKNVNGS
jgi:Predicted Zn-dependent protease (DUF2268)